MPTAAVSVLTPAQLHPDTNSIHTTLYDLIAAISEEVAPGEEHLVTATVVHLMNSGQVKFANDSREIRVVCPYV
jgi:hypothetical protein